MNPGYSSRQDIGVCRQLHRQHGKTYYFATRFFPARIQRRVHSVYGFVRVADEWVDNPGSLSREESADLLRNWRKELIAGVDGRRPEHPAMRAFVDFVHEVDLPLEDPLHFLDAMEMDLHRTRYRTYEDLRGYMRGSAAAVGGMMCWAMESPKDSETLSCAYALGEAMQLTNFLRDIGEDLDRGRIYLPLEDMEEYGVTIDSLVSRVVDRRFVELMKFEICRARKLYLYAERAFPKLPPAMLQAVMTARLLYAEILDCIEAQGYDVFTRRARTSTARKIQVAVQSAVAARLANRLGGRRPTRVGA